MKRILSLLAVLGLVAGSLLSAATPAQADDATGGVTFKVGKIAVKNLVVSTPGCQKMPIAIPYTVDSHGIALGVVNGDFFVFHGTGKRLARVDPFVLADKTNSGVFTESGYEFEDFVWCPVKRSPVISGLGLFTLRGVGIGWLKVGTPEGGGYDGTAHVKRTATFKVLQGSQFSSVTLAKQKTKRTLAAKLTYFNVAKQTWKALPKGTKVELQRRAADGSGTWKKVKTVRVGAKGAVKATNVTRTVYQYRFHYAGNSTTAKVGSTVLTK